MPKVELRGITTHYVQRGEGSHVVLVHGITSSLAMWYNGILASLSEKHRVTALDLRGHGLSTITETGYTSDHLSDDLIALLDQLEIPEAVLIGHSFGGAVSTHTALKQPHRVRGVALLDTGFACLRYLRIIETWDGWERRPEEVRERGFTLEEFLDIDRQQDVTEVLRRGLQQRRQAGFRKGQDAMTPRLQKLIDETRLGFEFRDVAGMTEEVLKTLTVPVLAMYGAHSPYQRMAEHLGKLLPHCRQQVLEGTGHFSAILRPQMLLPLLEEFAADPMGYVHRDQQVTPSTAE